MYSGNLFMLYFSSFFLTSSLLKIMLATFILFILSLSIRMIPFVFKTYEEIREVYAARGINSNVVNLLSQVLIRVIRDANSMGLALSSRGYESWDDK